MNGDLFPVSYQPDALPAGNQMQVMIDDLLARLQVVPKGKPKGTTYSLPPPRPPVHKKIGTWRKVLAGAIDAAKGIADVQARHKSRKRGQRQPPMGAPLATQALLARQAEQDKEQKEYLKLVDSIAMQEAMLNQQAQQQAEAAAEKARQQAINTILRSTVPALIEQQEPDQYQAKISAFEKIRRSSWYEGLSEDQKKAMLLEWFAPNAAFAAQRMAESAQPQAPQFAPGRVGAAQMVGTLGLPAEAQTQAQLEALGATPPASRNPAQEQARRDYALKMVPGLVNKMAGASVGTAPTAQEIRQATQQAYAMYDAVHDFGRLDPQAGATEPGVPESLTQIGPPPAPQAAPALPPAQVAAAPGVPPALAKIPIEHHPRAIQAAIADYHRKVAANPTQREALKADFEAGFGFDPEDPRVNDQPVSSR